MGNVASSVALVLVNKKVFSGGFAFPMTLSFFHFIFTVIWYQLLAFMGNYKPPESGEGMPPFEKFKVAAAGFASIGFMNLSLNTNSVGFYQITKLTIIPVTLVIQAIAYSVHSTMKIKIALAILLAGVGVATVTDVQLSPIGMVFGLSAVLTTAVFQIWQGTKQKEFGISATQLQAGIAPWQTMQAFVVAGVTEMYCLSPPLDGSACETSIAFFQQAAAGDAARIHTLWIVLGTCFLALAVNLCSFGLIGKTSAITFQVVGHAKTCLVLVGGYGETSQRRGTVAECTRTHKLLTGCFSQTHRHAHTCMHLHTQTQPHATATLGRSDRRSPATSRPACCRQSCSPPRPLTPPSCITTSWGSHSR